eukprot:scaffold50225_cov27-Prasinocladus_malaysianus.AAC.1
MAVAVHPAFATLVITCHVTYNAFATYVPRFEGHGYVCNFIRYCDVDAESVLLVAHVSRCTVKEMLALLIHFRA